jgi:transketolase
MATGSLGQGLPVGLGLALNAKFVDKSSYRTYVLMGDGESVEGSVWETADVARHHRLDNLCVIIDVNRLGQSDPTMLQHDMESYRSRWAGFGWHAIVVDGHNLSALLTAFDEASRTNGKPTILLAKTFKGRGISIMENLPDWHGKPLKKGEETQKAIAELTAQLKPSQMHIQIPKPSATPSAQTSIGSVPRWPYWVTYIHSSSDSTPMSKIPPTRTNSARSSPTDFLKILSPSKICSVPPQVWRPAARFPSSPHLPHSLLEPMTSSAWRRSVNRTSSWWVLTLA